MLAGLLTGAAAFAQSPFDSLTAPARLLSPYPGAPKSFISGLNIGWLNADYGFDLGPNLVAPRIGFHNATTFASDSPGTAASLVGGTGANVTRITVFEAAQGLTFDSNGLVSGITPEFLANLENELGLFRDNGLSAVLLLMIPADDGGVSFGVKIFGNVIATGGTLQNYYVPGPARDALISNGIGALAAALHRDGYDDAVFAYETLNEYNEAADNGVFNPTGQPDFNINYGNVNAFVHAASVAIRASGSPAYVTASSINFYNSYPGGTFGISNSDIDFFDLHEYNDTAALPTLDPAGIPVVLGECGSASIFDDAGESANLANFLSNAVRQGYAGVLPWYLGTSNTNAGDPRSFIVRDNAGPASTNVRPLYYLLEGFNAAVAANGAFP